MVTAGPVTMVRAMAGTVTLRLAGEFQGSRRLALTAVEVLVVHRPDVLVIDLAAVSSIDSAGVTQLCSPMP